MQGGEYKQQAMINKLNMATHSLRSGQAPLRFWRGQPTNFLNVSNFI
jgi:hypothetical protein